jgi:hypothetical protein
VGLAIGLVFVLNLSHPDESVYAYWIHFTAIAVAFSTVGAIVASHRPRHWVGWLFCMIGFLVAADHFCGEYAIYALMVHPEAFPAGEAAAWIRSWIWIVSGGFGVFLVLLFPNEHLPSVRWRYLAWLNVFVGILAPWSWATLALAAGPELSVVFPVGAQAAAGSAGALPDSWMAGSIAHSTWMVC